MGLANQKPKLKNFNLITHLYSFVILCQNRLSPDLELNSTCWDFKHNAKGGK